MMSRRAALLVRIFLLETQRFSSFSLASFSRKSFRKKKKEE
jgi:hypothetical protein